MRTMISEHRKYPALVVHVAKFKERAESIER